MAVDESLVNGVLVMVRRFAGMFKMFKHQSPRVIGYDQSLQICWTLQVQGQLKLWNQALNLTMWPSFRYDQIHIATVDMFLGFSGCSETIFWGHQIGEEGLRYPTMNPLELKHYSQHWPWLVSMHCVNNKFCQALVGSNSLIYSSGSGPPLCAPFCWTHKWSNYCSPVVGMFSQVKHRHHPVSLISTKQRTPGLGNGRDNPRISMNQWYKL